MSKPGAAPLPHAARPVAPAARSCKGCGRPLADGADEPLDCRRAAARWSGAAAANGPGSAQAPGAERHKPAKKKAPRSRRETKAPFKSK